MSYGMIFAIAVVLLLGWLHSSRKEAARQDVDRRIVPAVLDAALQQVQFTPNGRITCFGDSGLPLPQYDRMTGGEHVRARYRGYEVELCSIELDRDVSYTDPDDPTVVNAPSYDTVYAGLWDLPFWCADAREPDLYSTGQAGTARPGCIGTELHGRL